MFLFVERESKDRKREKKLQLSYYFIFKILSVGNLDLNR
jgi:hypothetical protein